MKKILIPTFIVLASMTMLCGCVFGVGTGPKTTNLKQEPTIGQQLIDLQRAKTSGAITDAEYQAEKAKILNGKPE